MFRDLEMSKALNKKFKASIETTAPDMVSSSSFYERTFISIFDRLKLLTCLFLYVQRLSGLLFPTELQLIFFCTSQSSCRVKRRSCHLYYLEKQVNSSNSTTNKQAVAC